TIFRDGAATSAPASHETLSAALRDPETLVWLDLEEADKDHIAWVAQEFSLQATEVEDALALHERPKVSRHGEHVFFTAYATSLRDGTAPPDGGDRLELSRISGFVLPSALITIRDAAFPIERVQRSWEDNADLLRHGPVALVHGLLDAVVDGHFETIQCFDDEIESLEDVLFEERRTGRGFLRRVYRVRKDIVALRRVVLPMRELVNGMLRHHPPTGSELDGWFDDLYDHVLRASEWTESLRDMVTSIFETNLSLQDARLNSIMKQLAAWAAIIAVPTAVTGWFGQNVPYPGFQQPAGLWLSVVLIVGMSIGLYAVFRRRGWI
ncbi:MAG TPA: magnesium transporter CorA family protein, partial [Intrasporangium sp.]|uniref:magnesium transporter CorA family protein n=1 Tax=Intrasporangium sp. TaxID=1925024 RepID=UPI002D76AFEB